jgi:hypothetical protein
MNDRVVCFAPDELKILRQITAEANEFGAQRLEPYGCTEADVRELVAVVQMVIKGNSPKELYYRTGFDFEEISAAVERIPTAP